ncbi:hypothetical protein KI387_010508, partial [Taxus chinensis]
RKVGHAQRVVCATPVPFLQIEAAPTHNGEEHDSIDIYFDSDEYKKDEIREDLAGEDIKGEEKGREDTGEEGLGDEVGREVLMQNHSTPGDCNLM